MARIPVDPEPSIAQAEAWCQRLEAGDILYFPQTPVPLRPEDLSFLLGRQQTGSTLHKNIAYKPNLDRVSGLDSSTGAAELKQLQTFMGQYSQDVARFLRRFLSPTKGAGSWTTPAFAPKRRRAATCRCAAVMICCTRMLSLRGLHAGPASCASSTIFTHRARATGWSAIPFPRSRPGTRHNRSRSPRPATLPAGRCVRWPMQQALVTRSLALSDHPMTTS